MALVFDVELPAVFIDPVTPDADATRLRLINRNPEPGELDLPPLTDIEVTIVDTSTSSPGINLAATQVYVEGVLAYDGGSGTPFKPGYDGAGSQVATIGTNKKRIVLDKVGSPFGSEQVVPVRVVTASTTGGATLDASYSFTVADSTAPAVLAAQAVGHKLVQVSFDDDVRQVGDGAVADALRAANYTLTPTTFPAVTPTVVGVRAVTSRLVELTLDIELTQTATYEVLATGVQDTSGNPTVAPYNYALFAGYACAVDPARRWDLYKMLPLVNRREDQLGTRDLWRFISCIQELVNLQLCEIDAWGGILDPDTAEEQFVDVMLADMGNPFDFDLSLEKKRLLLRVLVPMYKQKGTTPGIVNVVRFFMGLEVSVIPYSGLGMALGESELGSDGTDGTFELGVSASFSRYAFDVVVTTVLTDEQRAQLRALVEYMKDARDHFVRLIEPAPVVVIDHVELGLSELGVSWDLH